MFKSKPFGFRPELDPSFARELYSLKQVTSLSELQIPVSGGNPKEINTSGQFLSVQWILAIITYMIILSKTLTTSAQKYNSFKL